MISAYIPIEFEGGGGGGGGSKVPVPVEMPPIADAEIEIFDFFECKVQVSDTRFKTNINDLQIYSCFLSLVII